MSNVYSVEVIIKSNADLNPSHGVLKETFMPKLRCYSRNEAINAAIKSLSLMLEEDTCKHEWVKWPEWLTPTHNRCIKCDYRDEL